MFDIKKKFFDKSTEPDILDFLVKYFLFSDISNGKDKNDPEYEDVLMHLCKYADNTTVIKVWADKIHILSDKLNDEGKQAIKIPAEKKKIIEKCINNNQNQNKHLKNQIRDLFELEPIAVFDAEKYANNAKNYINKTYSKDYSKWAWKYKNGETSGKFLPKNRFVLSVMKKFVEYNKNKENFLDLWNEFYKLWNGPSLRSHVVEKINDNIVQCDTSRFFYNEVLTIQNKNNEEEKYVVSNQWALSPQFKEFIRTAKKFGFEVFVNSCNDERCKEYANSIPVQINEINQNLF